MDDNNKKKTYKWGILGTGRIAGKFVEDLKLLPNACLYAVGSRNKIRAENFAYEHGIPNAYGSYEGLASDPGVDIIYIATPHPEHYPNSILCFECKKAVLCEKPVAMNQRQFEQMVNKAEEKGCFFMEALWTRFIPSFIRCKEIVNKGLIGKVRIIESDFCFNAPVNPEGRIYNPKLGGGSLLDIGLYTLFFALEIGSKIVEIEAKASFASTGVDETCSMLLKHSEGEISVLFCSIATSGRVESIIHGSRGMIRLNRMWHTPTSMDLIPDNEPPQRVEFPEPAHGYQYEAAEVMKCLDEDRIESTIWNWEKSRQLIALLDRIRGIARITYPPEIEAI